MSRKSLVAKTMALLATSLALIAPASAQTTMLFSLAQPPTHFIHGVMHEWAGDVAKATENRVKVEFSAGSLAPPPQQLNAVRSSIFDVGIVANQFIKNSAPLVLVSQLPWLVNDAETASTALWRTYEKGLANANQFPDVQLLSLFQFNGGDFGSLSETPINSLTELKRRKMWALPGAAADTLKLLDISPITSPAVQVSESVSRGVVEGVYGLPAEALMDFKAAPYLKALTIFPRQATSTSFSLFVNKAKWASIPAKDRAAITQLSGEKLAAKVGKAANKASAGALAEMKAAGVKTVDGDAGFYAELQKASQGQFQAYEAEAKKAGVDGAAVLAQFRKEYRELSAR